MLIIIGIAVGVSVQIFIGSLIEGLQVSLIDKTIGNSPQVTVLPEGKQTKFKDSKTIIEKLDKEESFSAVSQSFDSSGFIFLDDELYPVFMRGLEFKRANEIYKFEDKLIEGRIPSNKGEIMIGKNLVEELSLKLNNDIIFQTPDKSLIKQRVVGVYDLKVEESLFTSIVGASGSGKSTLMNIIGALDSPTNGSLNIYGKDILKLNKDKLSEFRNETISFIFQFHYLLPEFTVLENILLPARIKHKRARKEDISRANELIEKVGLCDIRNNKATEISGGQQQRTAIARALIYLYSNNP